MQDGMEGNGHSELMVAPRHPLDDPDEDPMLWECADEANEGSGGWSPWTTSLLYRSRPAAAPLLGW